MNWLWNRFYEVFPNAVIQNHHPSVPLPYRHINKKNLLERVKNATLADLHVIDEESREDGILWGATDLVNWLIRDIIMKPDVSEPQRGLTLYRANNIMRITKKKKAIAGAMIKKRSAISLDAAKVAGKWKCSGKTPCFCRCCFVYSSFQAFLIYIRNTDSKLSLILKHNHSVIFFI